MKDTLLKISIRNGAIYVPDRLIIAKEADLNASSIALVANAKKLGYTFSEPLLKTLNAVTPVYKVDVLEALRDVMGVKKNWTPLVKDWGTPTGESRTDHLMTWFANLIGSKRGTTLQCGHLIPDGTFPLERYNSCPYCGTPFEFG